MKKLALYLFAATIMVSCNQKQESVEITKEKKEELLNTLSNNGRNDNS